MKIKIVRYDPVKGKGTFLAKGSPEEIPFTYRDFEHQMVEGGNEAELTKEGKIRPLKEKKGLWGRIKKWQ